MKRIRNIYNIKYLLKDSIVREFKNAAKLKHINRVQNVSFSMNGESNEREWDFI